MMKTIIISIALLLFTVDTQAQSVFDSDFIYEDIDGDGFISCHDKCPYGTLEYSPHNRLINAISNPADYTFESTPGVFIDPARSKVPVVLLKNIQVNSVDMRLADLWWSYRDDEFKPLNFWYVLDIDMVVDIYQAHKDSVYPYNDKILLEEDFAFNAQYSLTIFQDIVKDGEGIAFTDEPAIIEFDNNTRLDKYDYITYWISFDSKKNVLHAPYQFIVNNMDIAAVIEDDLRFYEIGRRGCKDNKLFWAALKEIAF